MKKLAKVLCVVLSCIFALSMVVSCDPKEGGDYTIKFYSAGDLYTTLYANEGETVKKPSDPKRSGYTFDYWAKDEAGNEKWDFSTAVTGNMNLYAVWKEGGSSPDNETRPLVMSSDAFDGVFNPFFGTSGPDNEITGYTQIGMLSSNAEGQPYAGEDEPSVAYDFKYTTYVNGEIDTDGSKAALLSEKDKKDDSKYYTEYELVLKNGIKFSDGTDLTIKDVLFNLYLYLDPVYTGSSTIYSTKIKGLDAYRTQDPDISSSSGSSAFEQTFLNEARARIDNLGFYYDSNATNRNAYRASVAGTETETQIMKDTQWIRKRFWSELKSDWNSAQNVNVAEDYKEYGFTESWEVFLLNVGIITATYTPDGTVEVDEVTGLPKVEYGSSKEWYHDEDNLLKIAYDHFLGILSNKDKGNYVDSDEARAAARAAGIEEYPQIDLNFKAIKDETGTVTGYDMSVVEGSKFSEEELAAKFKDPQLGNSLIRNIPSISRYWVTGSEALSAFTAEQKSNYFSNISTATGEKPVPTISGITVGKTTSFDGSIHGEVNFDDGEHYVLKIVIGGVDPKAIWNFGFSVAPMHYYSNPAGKDSGYSASDGYMSFNYPGVDGYDPSKPVHLGFKALDDNYISNVVRSNSIIKRPMGAGMYRISDSTFTKPQDQVTDQDFSGNLDICYFTRNENFKTTGEKMSNVRIKNLVIQKIDTTKVLESISQGQITYGTVNAKQENIDSANANPNLAAVTVDNNGYGYIGINARYVPDINIRKAIMTAMDVSRVLQYYTGGLAEVIYRPMSKVSWAYPTDAQDYYPYVSHDAAVNEVKKYISKSGGYQMRGGVLAKLNDRTGKWDELKYTFTIAGAETDHPAYLIFLEAEKVLEECGFDVTVKPDATALSKLSNGSLAVWAAAWSSTIDPDMYQVYHKESQAQSVKNWGYPYLITEQNGTPEEIKIIDELSALIDEGRSVNDMTIRADIYSRALNKVMELAVELPVYQRKNLFVYRKDVIDSSTVNQNPGAYDGILSRLWEVSFI